MIVHEWLIFVVFFLLSVYCCYC